MASELKHRVLVVEDSPTVQAWLRTQLPEGAHDVIYVTSVREARAAVQHSIFDLCLVDQDLPDGCGSDLIQELRQDNRFEDVPIALITAQDAESVIDRAFASGADEFLPKPLRPIEFHSRLSQCIQRKRACAEAKRDPLTHSLSRRSMRAALARAVSKAERTGESLSLLLLDLDRYKQVNDAQGHLAGDALLAHLAELWRANLRPYDLLFRFGGDEFIILLPATSGLEAVRVGNKLRGVVQKNPCPYGQRLMPVTLSCGAAQWWPGESIDSWVDRADQAQYEAKHRGGDQLVLSEQGVYAS